MRSLPRKFSVGQDRSASGCGKGKRRLVSKRIQDLVGVVELILEGVERDVAAIGSDATDEQRSIIAQVFFRARQGVYRRNAVERIRRRRDRVPSTVADKFVRQLRPHIRNTSHFDDTLAEWLGEQSRTLYYAMKKMRVDDDDLSLIEKLTRRIEALQPLFVSSTDSEAI